MKSESDVESDDESTSALLTINPSLDHIRLDTRAGPSVPRNHFYIFTFSQVCFSLSIYLDRIRLDTSQVFLSISGNIDQMKIFLRMLK